MKYCKRFERDANFTIATRKAPEHKISHMAKIGRSKWPNGVGGRAISGKLTFRDKNHQFAHKVKYCKWFERAAHFTTVTRTAHEHKMGHMAKIGRPKWPNGVGGRAISEKWPF